MTDSEFKDVSSKRLHYQLFDCVAQHLQKRQDEYHAFEMALPSAFPSETIVPKMESIWQIFLLLESESIISVGNYKKLKNVLSDANLMTLFLEVEKRETELRRTLSPVQESSARPIMYTRANSLKSSPGSHLAIQSSARQHGRLLTHLDRQLVPAMSEYRSFLTMVRAYLPPAVVSTNKGSVLDILNALQMEGLIGVGNYGVLKTIFKDSHLNALKAELERKEAEIQQAIQRENC